jgi:hypothetical protein
MKDEKRRNSKYLKKSITEHQLGHFYDYKNPKIKNNIKDVDIKMANNRVLELKNKIDKE